VLTGNLVGGARKRASLARTRRKPPSDGAERRERRHRAARTLGGTSLRSSGARELALALTPTNARRLRPRPSVHTRGPGASSKSGARSAASGNIWSNSPTAAAKSGRSGGSRRNRVRPRHGLNCRNQRLTRRRGTLLCASSKSLAQRKTDLKGSDQSAASFRPPVDLKPRRKRDASGMLDLLVFELIKEIQGQ